MKDVFKRFYHTPVQVYSLKRPAGNGYIGKDDLKTEKSVLCEMKADLQPYSGGLAEKEYGLSVNCQKCMYAPNSPYLKEGNYIAAQGGDYRILYAADWELGAAVLLEAVKI